MKYLLLLPLTIVLFGAGCSKTELAVFTDSEQIEANHVTTTQTPPAQAIASAVTLPVLEYGQRVTRKAFGEYIQDRFSGYHVGDDIEFNDEVSINKEIPVVAIADGTVTKVSQTSGYGGLITIAHEIDGAIVHALYGHLDLKSVTVNVGDLVTAGSHIANLGDHESAETDGERKHLHFALYEGGSSRLNGYVPNASSVNEWINPTEFFIKYKLIWSSSRVINPTQELGGDIFPLQFKLPEGMELEYVPSLQALNIFTRDGSGTARERSQLFVRFFDASSFLTLPTVTIHQTTDLTVGEDLYTAKRYDIEKKPGVATFVDQPTWRNQRHIVTDFRLSEGKARYFVIAKNPTLDLAIYETFLSNVEIFP